MESGQCPASLRGRSKRVLVVRMLAELLGWLTAVLLVGLGTFYLYLKRQYRYWEKLGVPGPRPEMLFGNMRRVFTLELTEAQLMEELYERYPEERYVGFYNLWKPTLLVRDLELIKKVTVSDFAHFTDHPQVSSHQGTDGIMKSLFFLKGDKWRSRRQVLSKTFTPRHLKEYSVDFKRALERLITDLHRTEGQDVDVITFFDRSSAHVVTAAFYGLDLTENEPLTSRFLELGEIFSHPPKETVVKFLFYSVAPGLHKLLGLHTFPSSLWEFYSALTRDLIAARQGSVSREDLISLIMKLMDEGFTNNEKMQFEEAVAHVYVWFLGSHHTSLLTICHALNLLARHPDVQEKVFAELKAVVGEDRLPDYEDLSKLSYLDAVISETMRLEPLVGVLKRACTAEFPLAESLVLPLNTDIYLPVSSLHHDPAYFPQPEDFRPERFLQGELEREAYMPFGKGPRLCVGARFGEMMMRMLLATLLQRFRVVPSPRTTYPFKYDPQTLFITNRPKDPVWVRFVPRKSSG